MNVAEGDKKVRLREYQKNLVKYMRTNRGVVAAFATGTGKTLTAIASAVQVLKDDPEMKIMVVTPPSLKDNFKKEMVKFGVDPNDKRYTFITPGIYLREYGSPKMSRGKRYKGKQCPGVSEKVFLIIDEAHNLKTSFITAEGYYHPNKGKIAQTLVRCSKFATKVLLLTATPLYNNAYDVMNLVAMVKGIDPLSEKEYYSKIGYTKLKDFVPNKYINKKLYKNKKFRDLFEGVFSFYDTDTESGDYPAFKEHIIPIEMPENYAKKYDEFMMITPTSTFLPYVMAARQASNNAEKKLDFCIKCESSMHIVKQGLPTLVYSVFRSYGVEKFESYLTNEGISYLEITGSTKQSDRQKIVERFNSGESKVLMITKAGGEGLDLKGVRNVIIFESSWNRAVEEQVLGRAIRFKSHEHLPPEERIVDIYYYLVTDKHGGETGDVILRDYTVRKDAYLNIFEKNLRKIQHPVARVEFEVEIVPGESKYGLTTRTKIKNIDRDELKKGFEKWARTRSLFYFGLFNETGVKDVHVQKKIITELCGCSVGKESMPFIKKVVMDTLPEADKKTISLISRSVTAIYKSLPVSTIWGFNKEVSKVDKYLIEKPINFEKTVQRVRSKLRKLGIDEDIAYSILLPENMRGETGETEMEEKLVKRFNFFS